MLRKDLPESEWQQVLTALLNRSTTVDLYTQDEVLRLCDRSIVAGVLTMQYCSTAAWATIHCGRESVVL